MPATIKPAQLDIAIAPAIARHTDPPAEHFSQLMTWGADERILCALATGGDFGVVEVRKRSSKRAIIYS
jgi:hypothetical protein